MNIWLHVGICIAVVVWHRFYLQKYCNYDSSGPYDPEQFPRLVKKIDRALYIVWGVLGLSTVIYFTTNPQ